MLTERLFLVSGGVVISRYMGEKSERTTETRIVRATSELHAIQKFKEHFTAMTSEYSVYYHVDRVEAHEEI